MELIISAVENVIVDTFENQQYNNFERVNVKAEEILRLVSERLKTDFNEVENIYLNVGPGSFTGIRASLALVLGLTAQKNINIIPFTSFDAFEYDKLTAKQILAVNGFSNFVYVAYLSGKNLKMDCVEIEKVIEMAKQKKMTILSYSDKILSKAKLYDVSTKKVDFSPEYAVKKYKNGLLEKRKLEPVYLRLSQAEIQRKENKK